MVSASQRLPDTNPRSSATRLLAVFRNEPLCGCAKPEIDRLSKQQYPGPDINVDAELKAAHPAREQHLRTEREQCACDPDQKHGAGQALGQQVLGIEQERLELRLGIPEREPWPQTGCLFGTGQCHARLRRPAAVFPAAKQAEP